MPLRPDRHQRISGDGIDTFYLEAGPANAPVLFLPHGYAASSFVYPVRWARPIRERLAHHAVNRSVRSSRSPLVGGVTW